MAPPTRLPCEGVMAMEITEGYFADVRDAERHADDSLVRNGFA
jgi:hypothetical protein